MSSNARSWKWKTNILKKDAFSMRFLLGAITVSLSLLLYHPLVSANTDPVQSIATTSATIVVSSPSSTDQLPPSKPILISPVDGTYTGDNRPEFIWRDSLDTGSNVVIYTLYLNNVATFLGVSNLGNSASSNYVARIDGKIITLKPLNALPDGTYSWQVIASDASGNLVGSASWSFVIDTTPPFIRVTDIDTYHDLQLSSEHPENFDNAIYSIEGPKDVQFTIKTEPWSTLTIKIYDLDNQLIYQGSWPTQATGTTYPFTHLELGEYLVSVSSFDRGGNTMALPDFKLVIRQSSITLPLPPVPGLPSTLEIPYVPITIPSLPATISKIQTTSGLSLPIYVLLAVAIYVLLIYLWRKRYNIILLDETGHPLSSLTIYHSIPKKRYKNTQIFVSTKAPISYTLSSSDRARLYIRHLARYSTLTIKAENRTYILSLSAKRKVYTIVLG